MTYELVKELKDAGFPQERGVYFYLHIPPKKIHDKARDIWYDRKEQWKLLPWGKKKGTHNETVAAPTLSELISELGDKFGVLDRFKDGTFGAYIPNDIGTNGLGATPEEAVARLYIALNVN